MCCLCIIQWCVTPQEFGTVCRGGRYGLINAVASCCFEESVREREESVREREESGREREESKIYELKAIFSIYPRP